MTTGGLANHLREILSERAARNPGYSIRALARDLAVSHTMLSQLIQGKKRLSFSRAVQLAQRLRLDSVAEKHFLRAAAMEAASDEALRGYLQELFSNGAGADEQAFYVLEVDRFKVLSEWYHLAILDLTSVESFVPDTVWVADRLAISVQQAQSAVSRLERLGLLEVRPGRWLKTSNTLAVPTTHPERAIQEFHDQMIEKARERLRSEDPEEFALRDITGTTMAIDPTRIPEAKKKIQKFRRDLFTLLRGEQATELYQLNVQLFRLTPEPLGSAKRGKKGSKRHV